MDSTTTRANRNVSQLGRQKFNPLLGSKLVEFWRHFRFAVAVARTEMKVGPNSNVFELLAFDWLTGCLSVWLAD